MTFRRHLLPGLCFWLCALAAGARSAPTQYRFNSWNTDTGLPQNTVSDIRQTRDGYLWLTTSDGLVRYDGVRFVVFNRSNSGGIVSNRFRTLYEGEDGALWAGTEDGGVTVLRGGRFTTYTTKDGLPDDQVWALAGDGAGGVLAFTRSGPARWDGVRFNSFPPGVAGSGFWNAFASHRGGIWYVDSGGLHKVDARGVVTYAQGDNLPAGAATAVCEDGRGDVWVATRQGLLARLSGGKFTTFGAGDGVPKAYVGAAFEDSRRRRSRSAPRA